MHQDIPLSSPHPPVEALFSFLSGTLSEEAGLEAHLEAGCRTCRDQLRRLAPLTADGERLLQLEERWAAAAFEGLQALRRRASEEADPARRRALLDAAVATAWVLPPADNVQGRVDRLLAALYDDLAAAAEASQRQHFEACARRFETLAIMAEADGSGVLSD